MTADMIWVHDDDLSPGGAALTAAPQAPAAYIYDPALIQARGYGLKRLSFIAECLEDLPRVSVWRGATVPSLLALADQAGAQRLVTSVTPCPHLKRIIAEVEAAGLPVTLQAPEPLVVPTKTPDLKRFSRYWRRAEPTAFKPTGLAPFQGDLFGSGQG